MFKKSRENHLFTSKTAFRILLMMVLCQSFFYLNAQSDAYFEGNFKIGGRIGVNSTTLKVSENLSSENYKSSSKMGLYAGANFTIPLSDYFKPFIELGFESENASIDYKNLYNRSFYSESFKGDISLKHISLGLCPNLVIPIEHINLNIYGGFHFSFLTSATEKGTYERVLVDTNTTQTTIIITDVNGKNKLLTDGFDTGLITGFGFEYKLDNRMAIRADSRFKFGTSLVANAYKTRSWGVILGVVYNL